MLRARLLSQILSVAFLLIALSSVAVSQRALRIQSDNSQFGPVMQAYLGYLRNEQEVVDDRSSRREITTSYYRRNSNRIRALREMAIRLVTKSGNDYVPELEAVTPDEFGTIFEKPPSPKTFRVNEIVTNTFRYLGTVNSGEVFYLFARLDPHEQAALMEAGNNQSVSAPEADSAAKGQRVSQTSASRPRRTIPR